MYIPEFWCGVAATILVEVVMGILTIVIGVATVQNKPKNK